MNTQQQNQAWEKWARLGQAVSRTPWTSGLRSYRFALVLFGVTLFHFWLASRLPPAEDELYYWSWAQHLQWSYYDHPPIVAYLIRASTWLFGNSVFGIRLFSCLIGTLVFFLLSLITDGKETFGYLLLTPIFFLGSIVMTPDLPLVFFWLCYVLWLIGVNRSFGNWEDDPVSRVYRASPIRLSRWAVGGALLGLGCLSKYTMLLAAACTFMVLCTRYRARSWLGGYVFHLALAALLCVPILVFNLHHDFTSFRFQWNHAMAGWDFSLGRFAEFLGSQVLLIGALPFLLLPWCLFRARELCRDATLGVCFHFFVLPILFFLFEATKGRQEANWPLIAYVTFWPLAERLLGTSSFRFAARTFIALAFLVPIACSAALLVHSLHPLAAVPKGKDRLGRMEAQFALSAQVAADLPRLDPQRLPFFAPTYQWTAYFRYRGVPAEQVFPDGRPSNFTISPRAICDSMVAVVFLAESDSPTVLKCFPKSTVLSEYRLLVRGEEAGRFKVVKYEHR